MNLFDVYTVFPINIIKGKGCYVYDDCGNSYLDFYGGHAVISIGHSHPYLVKCMSEQMQDLMFYSNSVVNKLQEKLAYELGEISGYPDYSAFFVNSGAEANENALKLASFHTGKRKIISFKNSFHGRTSAAVEVTDNPLITAPLNCNNNVYFSEMNIREVESVLSSGDVCAVIIEGISGVGGIRVPENDFLTKMRRLTTQYGAVLILDEIQSGYGRTGKFFAHQWSGIKPDIITVAKGIANGFPFSGVLISGIFRPRKGMLGTTFGGNHQRCAAALSVIKDMKENNLIENLSSNLSINRSSIRCEIKGNQVDEKYSVSHKEMRTYNHRLYEVSISNFPEIMRNDNFMLNGKHYFWMSIDDMRKDKEIIKKNLEIVEFVYSHIKQACKL